MAVSIAVSPPHNLMVAATDELRAYLCIQRYKQLTVEYTLTCTASLLSSWINWSSVYGTVHV